MSRTCGTVTDRLTVVGGARIDPYWQRIVSNNTGETGRNIDAPVNDRIGGRYCLTDMIAVHANWGDSFSLNTGANRNGPASDRKRAAATR